MNRKVSLSVCLVLVCLSLISNAFAQVPEIISYQGVLSDNGGILLTGHHDLTVRIYNQQTGGSPIWSENHTNTPVSNGVFNLQLGSVTAFNDSVDFSVPYWLGISINGGTELTPRTQFTSVGTALMAKNSLNNGVPTGMIAPFAMPTVPVNWLACNGQAVSRTTYAALFAVIGTMYGQGDGSTTFNLPDYRGYFLRGWDNGAGRDTDAASRTNRGDGTGGDNIGSKQEDAFKSHNHTYQKYNNLLAGMSGQGAGWAFKSTQNSGDTGGSETRPKNISVQYCIKY